MLVMVFIHTCRLQLRVNKSLCQDEAYAVFYHIAVIVQVLNIHLHPFCRSAALLCVKMIKRCFIFANPGICNYYNPLTCSNKKRLHVHLCIYLSVSSLQVTKYI